MHAGFVLQGEPHKCALFFVDNSGIDIILGVFPFVRELLIRGTQVRFQNDLVLVKPLAIIARGLFCGRKVEDFFVSSHYMYRTRAK